MTTSEDRAKPTFYAKWLSPEGYVGLHLTVGFVLAVLTGILFSAIADEVFKAPTTLAVDAWAQDVANRMQSPTVTAIMRGASYIGNASTLTALTCAVAVVLAVQRSHRRMLAFLASMIGGSLLNVVLKTWFQRPRPTEVIPLATAGGFSFPSGHSMGSMLFFGSLAYVVYFSIEDKRTKFKRRVLAVTACAVTILIIGSSRIYLGVHYLSDVVAGFTAGLCWLGVCLSATEGWVRWRDWRRARSATPT